MGSTVYGAIVSVVDIEKEFWKAIKSYILSLDTRITCAEDPDDEFDYVTKGNDHIATMNFKFNNHSAFKIYRSQPLRDESDQEIGAHPMFAINAAAGIPENIMSFKASSGIYPPVESASIERKIVISHIINDNFIFISFKEYWQTSGFGINNASVLFAFSGSNIYVGGDFVPGVDYDRQTAFNLSNYTLYDLAAPAYSGTFLSRFSYTAPQGNIDYIKSSIYQNNAEKVFENKAIYDCTTVTAGDTVSLKDGAYIAVGTNQLVKVS